MTTAATPRSTEPATREALELPLGSLVLSANQPRKRFDPQALEELTRSVRAKGVLQPILVRPLDDGRFEIVAGERRYLASQRAGRSAIPAVVLDLSDQAALEVALLENLQRQNLTEIEETEGVLHLLSLRLERSMSQVVSLLYRMDNEAKDKVTLQTLGSDEGRVVEATFAALGRIGWQSFVAARLPLLKLPSDLLEALRAGEVSPIRARLLARLPDEAERREVLERANRERWNNTALRERVSGVAGEQHKKPVPLLGRFQVIADQLCRDEVWHDEARRRRARALVRELAELLAEETLEHPAEPAPPSAAPKPAAPASSA